MQGAKNVVFLAVVVRKYDFFTWYELPKNVLIAWLQESRLDHLQGPLDFGVSGGLCVELASNLADSLDDCGAPLVNGDVNAELVRLFWVDLLDGVNGTSVVVHIEEGLHRLLHDDRVAHLPDRQRTALHEALNPEGRGSVDKLRAQAGFGHAPEDSVLHLFVNDITLKLAIEKLAWRLTVVWQRDITFQSNLVACVGQAVKLRDIDLIRRLDDIGPAGHVLQDVFNYDLFILASGFLLDRSGCVG